MSALVLTDCVAWVGGLAATTYSNSLSVKQTAEEKPTTCFGGGGWKSVIGGLKTVEVDLKGFWESAVDEPGFTNMGVADTPMSFGATATETTPFWFFQGSNFNYDRGGGVGDVDPFGLSIRGTNSVGLAYGQLAKAKGDVSTTGAIGSAVQLGAGSAGKYLYAVLHVFTAGTTISMKVQSDDNSGFTSASDVASATINSVTAVGATWMTRVDASAITDDWFRLNVTTCTGTFNIGAALAIQ